MLKKEEFVDSYLSNLISTGSDKNQLLTLKKEILYILNHMKDYDPSDNLKYIIEKIIEGNNDFLNCKNDDGINVISGLASSILINDKTSKYLIKIYGGNVNRNKNAASINSNTIFDIASITKFFTLLLLNKLQELKLIDFNSNISNYTDFKHLNYTIEELIKMSGIIRTDTRICTADNKYEAYEILKGIKPVDDNDKTTNQYTDMGFIVLGYAIESIVNEKLSTNYSFEQILNKFLLEPLNLTSTVFNPDINQYTIAGNGNDQGLVHDPKSRLLGGTIGSAGLFTNLDDLVNLANKLLNEQYLSFDKIKKFGTVIFPNSDFFHRGYGGLYLKHPLGIKKTYVQPIYADGSFASEGYTGSAILFDSYNKIHNGILVSSLEKNADKKPEGFAEAFNRYQTILVNNTFIINAIKKYYNEICNNKEEVTLTYKL